jgi:hypothetical protein
MHFSSRRPTGKSRSRDERKKTKSQQSLNVDILNTRISPFVPCLPPSGDISIWEVSITCLAAEDNAHWEDLSVAAETMITYQPPPPVVTVEKKKQQKYFSSPH